MEPLVLYDSTRAENPAIDLYEHDNKTCGSIQSHHAIQIIGEYTGMLKVEYSLDGTNWGDIGAMNYMNGFDGVTQKGAAPNVVYVYPAIPARIRVNVSAVTITSASLKVLLI